MPKHTIDYEMISHNEIEAISSLLEAIWISSTPTPDLTPPITTYVMTEPNLSNPYKTDTDIDIASSLKELLTIRSDMMVPLFRFYVSE